MNSMRIFTTATLALSDSNVLVQGTVLTVYRVLSNRSVLVSGTELTGYLFYQTAM